MIGPALTAVGELIFGSDGWSFSCLKLCHHAGAFVVRLRMLGRGSESYEQ